MLHKIYLLIWKNIQIYKHKWIQTCIEILVPLLLFYMNTQLILNTSSNDKKEFTNTDQIYSSRNAEDLFESSRNIIVFYTPNDSVITEIMDKAKGISNIAADHIRSFENQQQMFATYHSRYKGNNSTIVIPVVLVTFFSPNVLSPSALSYEIRDTRSMSNYHTEDLYDFNENIDLPSIDNQYDNSGFAGLQLAIDIGFSMAVNKSYTPWKFFIQQFPFIESTISVNDFFRISLDFLPGITVFSFTILSVSVLKRVVEEKQTGVTELTKMMGLENWMVWIGWLLNALMKHFISITIITFLLKVRLNGDSIDPLLKNSDSTLIWILLLVYCIAGIFFCFAISTLFNHPTLAMSVGLFSWIGSYMLVSNLSRSVLSTADKLLLMILPNGAINYAMKAVADLESQSIGATWDRLFYTANGKFLPLGLSMIMLLVDCAFYALITWYIDAVHPGRYGVPKPYTFIFSYFTKKTNDQRSDDTNEMMNQYKDNKFVEKTPSNVETGIRVVNLRKDFGRVQAVKGISLNILKGEITALLGHNGAGKSTTMSLLTGMLPPTSGNVYFENTDVFKDMKKFRSSLGMCPQDNLLFPYLTVWEHLIFFAMLKGNSKSQSEKEAYKLLSTLGIHEKKHSFVSQLSGGMKRKLSLSVALIGNPKILMLDEPTSGMDVESRRSMWDLLLGMRGNRTVLLTTHFMEEADVLGDRIAIMDHGDLFCYGSSIFLKKALETGYQLSIRHNWNSDNDVNTNIDSRIDDENVNSNTSTNVHISKNLELTIRQHVPGVVVKHEASDQIDFSLPLNETKHFPDLFKKLESDKKKFGIVSIGVSCTTMEEVFIKVGRMSEVDSSNKQYETSTCDDQDNTSELLERRVTGLALFLEQIKALFLKRFRCSYRRYLLLFFYTFVPILFGVNCVRSSNTLMLQQYNSDLPKLQLSLSSYSKEYDNIRVVLGSSSESSSKLENVYRDVVKEQAASLDVFLTTNVSSVLLSIGQRDKLSYWTQIITAAQFDYNSVDDSSVTIFYNTYSKHGLPVAINLYTNAFIRWITASSNFTINTINHPMQTHPVCPAGSADDRLLLIICWMMLFLGLVTFTGYFILMVNNERVTGAKHIQMMSDLSPLIYWFTNFLYDLLLYIIIISLMLPLMKSFDVMSAFTGNTELAILFMILFLFGISCIMYVYVFSHLTDSFNSCFALYSTFNEVIGMIVCTVLYMLKIIIIADEKIFSQFWTIIITSLTYISYLFPPFTLFSAICSFVSITWNNNHCLFCQTDGYNTTDKCHVDKKLNYLETATKENPYGILTEIKYFVVAAVLYAFILSFLNMQLYDVIYSAIINRIHGPYRTASAIPESVDLDVKKEKDRVDSALTSNVEAERSINIATGYGTTLDFQPDIQQSINGADSSKNIILIVNNLMKYFIQRCSMNMVVKGVSFAVTPGECFGLLGINGAGKTTTFKMLTGELLPNGGDASIDKHKISTSRNKYLSMVGYCPQFNAIIDELTAREMLQLICTLRGISKNNVKQYINKWISVLGLGEYQNRRCGTYSGGNKRKLSTAIALIGDPEVVFLDEPTTGVDPVSRRKLYDVMDYSKKIGQAVVLTSHSMDECETLCDRLTIMADGQMKCIGSVQYLKKQYAQGFTLLITLKDVAHIDDKLSSIKKEIPAQFSGSCSLKDEHKTLLNYRIENPNIPWSFLFEKMEDIKSRMDIVGDYTISDTTLEQVFISFSK